MLSVSTSERGHYCVPPEEEWPLMCFNKGGVATFWITLDELPLSVFRPRSNSYYLYFNFGGTSTICIHSSKKWPLSLHTATSQEWSLSVFILRREDHLCNPTFEERLLYTFLLRRNDHYLYSYLGGMATIWGLPAVLVPVLFAGSVPLLRQLATISAGQGTETY